MKKTLLIFLSLAYLFCGAQQGSVDSIMGLLAKHPKQDTVELSLLGNLSFYYRQVNPERGIKLADSAIELIKNLDATNYYLATLYFSKAYNLTAIGKIDEALVFFRKAETFFLQLNKQNNLADVYLNTASALMFAGKYDSALKKYNAALETFIKLADKKGEAKTYLNNGILYQYIQNYPKALESFNKARMYFEQSKDKLYLAGLYGNIALVYYDLYRFDESLKYFKLSQSLFKETGSTNSEAQTLLNIGSIYFEKHDYNKAIEVYRETLQFEKKLNNGLIKGTCLENMGCCFLELKEYDKAFFNIKEGLPLLVVGGDGYIQSFNYLSKIIFKSPAQILVRNGIVPKERYSQALLYARKAQSLAKIQQSKAIELAAWQNMSDIYEAQGNYKAALNAYKEFTILKDTVFNTEKAQAITRNEMQYDYDKEKLLAVAENERKQQAASRKELLVRVVIIASFIVLLIGTVFYLLYKRKKKEAILTGEKMLAEEKMRRAQMNPHFIFNSMNLISNYIKNEPDIRLQRNYIVSFAKLMRLVLEASVKDETSLTNDLKLLEAYLQLEMKRKNDGFDYSIKIDENLDADKVLVPPMLLLPLAENSIWHGFENIQRMGKVEIQVSKNGDLLQMVFIDNGIGRKKAAETPSSTVEMGHEKSYGLNITKTRIEKTSFYTKKKSSFEISDLDEGTSVEIKIPFKTI